MDANQCWDVDEAISYMKQLAKFKPVWIEEPTSPDDVLGKLAILTKLLLIGKGILLLTSVTDQRELTIKSVILKKKN